jgi:hypothetical protein
VAEARPGGNEHFGLKIDENELTSWQSPGDCWAEEAGPAADLEDPCVRGKTHRGHGPSGRLDEAP